MTRLFWCLLCCGLTISARAQGDSTGYPYVYTGVIETNTCQQLSICLTFLVRPDRTLIGSYYYHLSGTSLKLRGRLRADNSFMLVERDHDGRITGYFEGGLSLETYLRRATGIWRSPSGAITFTFQAQQQAPTSHQVYGFRYRDLPTHTTQSLARKTRQSVLSIDWERRGLTHVPQGISHLPRLLSLNLLGNQLTAFPPVLSRVISLQELSLSSNQLTRVDPTIASLKNLKVLTLNFNQLTDVSPALGELSNLLYLDLSSNRLTRLPDAVQYLTRLQELHLEGNPFSGHEQARLQALLPYCRLYFTAQQIPFQLPASTSSAVGNTRASACRPLFSLLPLF
jgi:hypothetical protein